MLARALRHVVSQPSIMRSSAFFTSATSLRGLEEIIPVLTKEGGQSVATGTCRQQDFFFGPFCHNMTWCDDVNSDMETVTFSIPSSAERCAHYVQVGPGKQATSARRVGMTFISSGGWSTEKDHIIHLLDSVEILVETNTGFSSKCFAILGTGHSVFCFLFENIFFTISQESFTTVYIYIGMCC